MATNTRKLAALLGASGAGIADAGTINTAGITADAIDNTKIADNAVNDENIAAGQVVADIAAGTVTTAMLADNAVSDVKLNANVTDGSIIQTGVKPHIIPGTLYPGLSDKKLDGTALAASTTGPAGSTVTSSKYGTVQSDGRMYYYTDIKGSKPIKDPRIGSHFGSQRHKFKSLQILEQETALHGDDIYSIDGREWCRAVGDSWSSQYNTNGNYIMYSGTSTSDFIEIVGYFSDANLLAQTDTDREAVNVKIDGGTDETNDHNVTVASPLVSRYVDAGSLFNLSFNGGNPTLGIHTLKLSYLASDFFDLINGIELIAQDTTSTATKSKIQIPAQNVVSYGKKFVVSAAATHYDPFNGFTNGNAISSYIDESTSLGMNKWKLSSTWYRPFNGGRVVKWVDSTGTIKTSVTMMPPNAKSIANSASPTNAFATRTTASHFGTNNAMNSFEAGTDLDVDRLSEVAKTFHYREFGNGGANAGTGGANYADASMLASTADDIAYVMDDGLTSLMGDDVLADMAADKDQLSANGDGDFFIFTFIGTGISITTKTFGAGTHHIVQNLPYGTHIVKKTRVSAQDSGKDPDIHIDGVLLDSVNIDTYAHCEEVTFHQPKKPPIPEDACVIADYMLMADFKPQTTHGVGYISKGVRANNISRDVFFNETDGDSYALAQQHGNSYGFQITLSGNADSDTSATSKLVGFGTNYVHRAFQSDTRVKLYLDGVAKDDGTAGGGSAVTNDNNADHGSYAHLANDLALGVYSFEANSVQGQAINQSGFEIATPIHTSNHYQPFETPTLHELIGGDRNMEQTNLVVSPDGKTWDEVTRDTSYIGNIVIQARNNAETGDAISTAYIRHVYHRGYNFGVDCMNKDSWAITYDGWVCLKDGQYDISMEARSKADSIGTRLIYKNGIILAKIEMSTGTAGYANSVGGYISSYFKKGDTLYVKGRHISGNTSGVGLYSFQVSKSIKV